MSHVSHDSSLTHLESKCDDITAPSIALHTLHSALPGLLRSFPVPTPAHGCIGMADQSLISCLPEISSLSGTALAEAITRIRAAASANAALVRSELGKPQLLESLRKPDGAQQLGLSPAAATILSALLEDDAGRKSQIDSRARKIDNETKGTPIQGRSAAAATVSNLNAKLESGNTAPTTAEVKRELSGESTHRMVLRPRKACVLPKEMQASRDAKRREVSEERKPEKLSKTEPDAAVEKSRKRIKQERIETLERIPPSSEKSVVTPAECIHRSLLDAESLLHFINTLQADGAESRNAFDGVCDDSVARFLAALVATDHGGSPSPVDISTQSIRAVSCLLCLTHAKCTMSWISETLVENVITQVGSVVRFVKRSLVAFEKEWTDVDGNGTKRTSAHDKKKMPEVVEPRKGVRAKPMLPSHVLRLMETIRACCRRLANLCADAGSGLVSDADVLRLEELAVTIVTVPYDAPNLVTTVFDYVGRDALLLHETVWNRIETQRDGHYSQLCERLPLASTLVLTRLVELEDHHRVMPLSWLLVSAAQSWPVFVDALTQGTVDQYFRQLAGCAACIQNKIFEAGADADDRELRGKFFSQFVEDLVILARHPHFPAASPILRSVVFSLSRTYLTVASDEEVHTTKFKCRSVVIEVLGRVIHELVSHHAVTTAAPMQLVCLEEPVASEWIRTVRPPSSTQKRAGKRHKAECGQEPAEEELSPTERNMCAIYATWSEKIRTATVEGQTAEAARCFHMRKAHLFVWARNQNIAGLLTERASSKSTASAITTPLDSLCRATQVAMRSSAIESLATDTGAFSSLVTDVQSQSTKSCLHVEFRDVLLSLILQVVRLNSSNHQWDSVRKKAMGIVAKLLTASPMLVKSLWPIAAQATRDETARVRESASILLQHMLSACLRTSVNPSCSEDDVRVIIMNIVVAVTILIDDRSAAVVQKSLTLAEDLLLANNDSLQGRGNNSQLTAFVRHLILRVMGLIDSPEHGPAHGREIAVVLAKRWGWYPMKTVKKMENDKDDAERGESRKSPLTIEAAIDEISWLTTCWLSPPYELGQDGRSNHIVSVVRALCSSLDAQGRRSALDQTELGTCMARFAKRIIHGVNATPPDWPDCGKVLAILHAIALGKGCLLDPVAEAIGSLITVPEGTPTEQDAVRNIQSCHILCALLGHRNTATVENSSGVSLVADNLVAILHNLINRYSGPLQQRVLVGSVSVLCHLIEPAPTASSKHLKYWFQNVNGCYVRLANLVSQLVTAQNDQAQLVGYITRFLFVLSEFLRGYHDWTHVNVHRLLCDPVICGSGGRISAERGILKNVQWLVSQLIDHCPSTFKSRLMPLIIRLVGSLCIADPTGSFRCHEALLQDSLVSPDESLQTQALLIIRDFLHDEDYRISSATEAQGKTTKPFHARDDMNSGMATWVIQRFQSYVVEHGVFAVSPLVRQLSLEILDASLQQGLIPPSVFVESLIVLTLDQECPSNVEKAKRALTTLADRHEDAVVPKAVSGILKGFRFVQRNSKGDVVSWTVQFATELHPHRSVHEALFKCVSKHKKHRESVIVGLLRVLYAPASKQQPFCATHDCGDLADFLAYLALTLAFLPYHTESDVLLAIAQCSTGLDLTLQTASELLQRGTDQLGSCCGAILLGVLKRYLRKEYGISQNKLEKFSVKGACSSSLTATTRRDIKSAAGDELIASVKAAQNSFRALLTSRQVAIQCLRTMCEEITSDECTHLVLEDKPQKNKSKKQCKRARNPESESESGDSASESN